MIILGIILIFLFIFTFYLFLKSDNAQKNHMKILLAIDAYADDKEEYLIALEVINEMEHFATTIFRLWDWGYTNILPKQYFELIKPYIK